MIDARGLSCPIPVVMVQQEVKKSSPETLQVQVDAMVCVENITRFAGSHGYDIAVDKQGDEFLLTLTRQ